MNTALVLGCYSVVKTISVATYVIVKIKHKRNNKIVPIQKGSNDWNRIVSIKEVC